MYIITLYLGSTALAHRERIFCIYKKNQRVSSVTIVISLLFIVRTNAYYNNNNKLLPQHRST